MQPRVRLFIVEDSPAIREGLIDFLGHADGVEVIGSADTPGAAIAAILALGPDCVLLDFQLKGGTGIDVMKAVRTTLPAVVFIVLTSHTSTQYRRACMNAGAAWFLDKNQDFTSLPRIVAGTARAPATHAAPIDSAG